MLYMLTSKNIQIPCVYDACYLLSVPRVDLVHIVHVCDSWGGQAVVDLWFRVYQLSGQSYAEQQLLSRACCFIALHASFRSLTMWLSPGMYNINTRVVCIYTCCIYSKLSDSSEFCSGDSFSSCGLENMWLWSQHMLGCVCLCVCVLHGLWCIVTPWWGCPFN